MSITLSCSKFVIFLVHLHICLTFIVRSMFLTSRLRVARFLSPVVLDAVVLTLVRSSFLLLPFTSITINLLPTHSSLYCFNRISYIFLHISSTLYCQCPSNSFVPYSVQLGDSNHPSVARILCPILMAFLF